MSAAPAAPPAVDAVVIGAMEEEVRPYLERAGEVGPETAAGHARTRLVTVGAARLLLVRGGIGLVNAAAATVHALMSVAPRAVVSTGSAGGLAAAVEVGDVVVGERYTYAGADATAFGYERGQVPGMPPAYDADPGLLAAARGAAAPRLRTGQMVSGDSFVTAVNVAEVRAAFPAALSTDMESTAIAQVCHSHGVPFLSVRGISDLCGPAADQDFHMAVEEVAARAADVVLDVLGAGRPRG
ncbi:5'-methylthioadenosine/S-adenosylhomocysteine nucleosidase [Georgenia ruanii]|uniref:adenosylhomocysteine nucleosidase n=1 Tax=Georgenia ruanii TaxID=348442 RepID=A0A7J9UWC7_9MICO|nr:5'-methylthioadenosine/S-adenosylhomocysteine nucleosidase [Georgenia ruanii]MPV88935.1 5'-methylthioadenosine/S-adenosylhomocysteine nucleosidase [Georgenia ruanii]